MVYNKNKMDLANKLILKRMNHAKLCAKFVIIEEHA